MTIIMTYSQYMITMNQSRWNTWKTNYRFRNVSTHQFKNKFVFVYVPYASAAGMTIRKYFEHLIIGGKRWKIKLT